jgi:N-acetylmuramic acid 6-phosphate etherase
MLTEHLSSKYDWPSDRIASVMTGRMQAVLQIVEGADDNEAKGVEAIADADVHQHDVVTAVVASGTTPFTIGALHSAGARGALCIAVANNRAAPLIELARHRILIESGTERGQPESRYRRDGS